MLNLVTNGYTVYHILVLGVHWLIDLVTVGGRYFVISEPENRTK